MNLALRPWKLSQQLFLWFFWNLNIIKNKLILAQSFLFKLFALCGILDKKVNANLLHWGECIIWFKIPLITCTPLWFFHSLRQPVERGTVLVFLPGDYKLHMYFIVWTKQYSISKPKRSALPAHSVCLVMTNALTLAKEKNLCKTYLLRIVNFKDSEF